MTFTSSYKMWHQKQKEPPGMYTLPFKGVMDDIHCSLFQLYSTLYFREVESSPVENMMTSPVENMMQSYNVHEAQSQRVT